MPNGQNRQRYRRLAANFSNRHRW